MFIRELVPRDLDRLRDIDGTVESMEYLHVDASGEGMTSAWRIEPRPLREKRIDGNPLGEDATFLAKQIATGADEGVALVSEYDDNLIGLLIAQAEPAAGGGAGLMRVVDVRIDFDYRRQGMGSALMYQLITVARERGLRAVAAEARTNNLPANAFLQKVGFDLCGVDTRRHSNHDLVK